MCLCVCVCVCVRVCVLGGGGVWKGERFLLQLHGLTLFCVSYYVTNLGFFVMLFTCIKKSTSAHVFYMLFNKKC